METFPTANTVCYAPTCCIKTNKKITDIEITNTIFKLTGKSLTPSGLGFIKEIYMHIHTFFTWIVKLFSIQWLVVCTLCSMVMPLDLIEHMRAHNTWYGWNIVNTEHIS